MEFKGIAWAGNIYQKFEAMCLEVEEVMYQDTVTYFENQVQTVGASVKKFYSEVMEDFQPPSCMDPVKGAAAADLPLNPYSHTGFVKKPKKNIPEDRKEVRTNNLENCEVIADAPAVHSPMSTGCSELYNRKRKNGGLYRRPTAISKGSSIIRDHLSKTPGSSATVSRNPSSVSLFREMKNEVPTEKVRVSTASHDSPALDTGLSLEADRQKQDNSGSTTTTTTITELSSETPDSGTQNELSSCMESTINAITCASGGEDVVLACEGVASNVVDPELEFVERLDASKFEETCVLVEENKVHIASRKETKHKSYKKKIRDALTSKMKSTRKQEYEKLAAQYSKESAASLTPTSYEESNQESEWELL